MQATTLSFANLHTYGELFANLLRARRQTFIVQNRWELPEALGMEYDQYDTPASRWIAVHDDIGHVYAGIRLTPTTARCGIYSYMIRDAQRGLLPSIPTDLIDFEAPVDPTIWESSRVFVSSTTRMALRRRVHTMLVTEMTRTARELGALQVLCLIPSNWPRWAQRCGLDMSAAGRPIDFDGYESQCARIDLTSKTH